MKLSFKFFCIAYITVLLSMGIGGILLISNAENVLWSSKNERVSSAMNYACDSFVSFADISSGEIDNKQLLGITSQIKGILDSAVTKLEIIPESQTGNVFSSLKDNEGYTKYIRKNGSLYTQSVCRLNTDGGIYYVVIYSDYTDIENQCNLLWRVYQIVVLALAVLSGASLYVLTKKVAKPINNLTKAAKSISKGNYGETVEIKTSDKEIKRLSESFNTMSVTVKDKILEIQEESNKRNMFVADFTHEIKTPMTAIIGYAEMLNTYNLTQKEIKQASKAIYKEGKRLEKLSLQMLELYVYRNEDVELEPICLYQLTNQVESTLIFLSRKYNVPFSVEFEEVEVMANSVLLLSLIYNLADNGFKASIPEKPVRIYSQKDKEGIRITVEDQGKGISPENMKFLTLPFFREDKARSRKLGGAGLGLALCKEIAKQHGTQLNFESQVGKGTKAWFVLKEAENEE